MDLHNSKDISSDVYSSSLLPKSLTYESPASQGYSLSLDAHLIDQYVDQRAGSVIPSGTSDRDSWEQSVPDNLGQLEACPEPLQVAPASSCLSAHEPGTVPHCRNSNWNLTLSGMQSYSFHPLEDVQYPAVFSTSSNSPFSSFMAAAANDLPGLKILPGSSGDSSDTAALQDSSSFWPKEDPSLLWGARRTSSKHNKQSDRY
ncbi:hypothetical protein E2320_007193 [Naja naja]|nr:hypothetical protein E2320_007193 [Naja naja]